LAERTQRLVVEFIDKNGGVHGARLRKRRQKRLGSRSHDRVFTPEDSRGRTPAMCLLKSSIFAVQASSKASQDDQLGSRVSVAHSDILAIEEQSRLIGSVIWKRVEQLQKHSMRGLIRSVIDNTWLYYWLRSLRNRLLAGPRTKGGASRGSLPSPPEVIKQNTVREYASRYGLRTLVETGTYLGDMVEASRGFFERIYTIELSQELAARATKRFTGATNVQVLQGDSGEVVADLVKLLHEPALFWLDAHYSAGITAKGEVDTPILKELSAILAGAPNHILLIDDARCFGSDPAYPTIEEVTRLVRACQPHRHLVVENDIIRITPEIGAV